ncbi:hypothetical protein SDC9_32926 [bioreactor metagenome]|jgi:hypothetical protein|uniref:Trimeric autotransporter adhesin YadA-like head domain-containing protein n=2 Tax=root TaxID=1 RepID=A0A644V6G8_9ZZZZ
MHKRLIVLILQKINMKQKGFLWITVFVILTVSVVQAQVAINADGSAPDNSAMLDVKSSNKGILITRIALTGANDYTTIASPANSLLVFNTATAGTGSDAVVPGFYYWEAMAGRWRSLSTNAGQGGDVWIDLNSNILSANSAGQMLQGSFNIALGEGAFSDPADPSDYVIAIGPGVCNSELTGGEAFVVAIGANTAFFNSGTYLNAFGMETAYNNTGDNVNAMGMYAATGNSAYSVNAFGVFAAASNTGDNTNAFGPSAAQSNQGSFVNAIGQSACSNNAGTNVNALGYESAYENTGQDVNACGFQAAFANTQWAVNALGAVAARNNSGYLVNSLGAQSCESNTGNSVNGMGHLSAQENQGSEVNAMGAMSAQFNSSHNVNALGNKAAQYNTGWGLNAFGLESAQYNTGADVNAFGVHAARYNNGDNCVAIGERALSGSEFADEGQGNIAIGYQAAMNIGSGANNIAIGYDVQLSDGDATNQINIGNSIIRDEAGVIQLKDLIQLTPTNEPASPEAGMIYFDSTSNMLRYYNGETWINL